MVLTATPSLHTTTTTTTLFNTHRHFRELRCCNDNIRGRHQSNPMRLRVIAMASKEKEEERDSRRSYYEVLGVEQRASVKEIKSAYRRLARTLHPDIIIAGAHTPHHFISINQAYATLSDPALRADYDHALRRQHSTSTPTTPGPPSSPKPRCSSWETDQCW